MKWLRPAAVDGRGQASVELALALPLVEGTQSLAHDLGGTGDFIDGFALHPQAQQKSANLHICCTRRHDLAHDVHHLFGGKILIL